MVLRAHVLPACSGARCSAPSGLSTLHSPSFGGLQLAHPSLAPVSPPKSPNRRVLRPSMLGRGLPGDGATGCCAVHLSPIVTVLFCLVCALDCVTGEVRRSNQALSNGPWPPAAGRSRGTDFGGEEGKEGQGQRCGCMDGCRNRTLLEHPHRGVGMAPGRATGQKSSR